MMDELYGRSQVHDPDYQACCKEFSVHWDQMQDALDPALYSGLNAAYLDYLNAEQTYAFRLGLRLGLKLHAL